MDINEEKIITPNETNNHRPNWTEEQWKAWNDAMERIKSEALLSQKQSNINFGWI